MDVESHKFGRVGVVEGRHQGSLISNYLIIFPQQWNLPQFDGSYDYTIMLFIQFDEQNICRYLVNAVCVFLFYCVNPIKFKV